MDQDNNPFFSNDAPETPGEPPQQVPVPEPGARIYEPSVPYAPSPVQPVAPVTSPPANNSRRIWIIVLIVLLVLCCCCVLLGVAAWNLGDQVLCSIDPNLGTCLP